MKGCTKKSHLRPLLDWSSPDLRLFLMMSTKIHAHVPYLLLLLISILSFFFLILFFPPVLVS